MSDDSSGESHTVAQAHHQAKHRLKRASRFPVGVNENQGADHQRDQGCHRRVPLRLQHLVIIQHRFARQADIQAGHFEFRLAD